MSSLFSGLDVRISGRADAEVTALAYDSRQVTPGALFAALVGAKSDGHAFVSQALARGASCILCEKPVDTGSAPCVIAPDSRWALAHAAERFYGNPADELLMVGVTGTNGKTTTVHLVESILGAAGQKPAMIGTLGSRMGSERIETGLTTPESVDVVALIAHLAREGATAVAMEVSSHALAQERVAGLRYDIGVFTNLTHDHLDYHGTLEKYFAAKARLFGERLKPGGRAVLNLDDARVRTLATAQALGFSGSGDPAAALRPIALDVTGEGISGTIHTPKGVLKVRSALIGRFNVENLLAAAAVGVALDLDLGAIARGLAGVAVVPGRLERVSEPGEPLVLVDYAHTPDALAKALAVVREVTAGKLICVFGCGGDRDAEKRPLMGEVAARQADWSIITNDNPRSEEPETVAKAIEAGFERVGITKSSGPERRGYAIDLDRAAAIGRAIEAARPGDAVLVAGKGHETYQLVGGDRRVFDDREQGRQALGKWAHGGTSMACKVRTRRAR